MRSQRAENNVPAAARRFWPDRGLAPAHRWLVDDLLADGRSRQVLPAHRLVSVPINMLIAPEQAKVDRVRLLDDFLLEAGGA